MEIITLIENNLGKNQNLKNEFGLSFLSKITILNLSLILDKQGYFFIILKS